MSISTITHKTSPDRNFEFKTKQVARTRRVTISVNTVAGWKTRLTKTTVNELQVDSQCSGLDPSRDPLEYKSEEVLRTAAVFGQFRNIYAIVWGKKAH